MCRFVVFLAICLTASADDNLDLEKCHMTLISKKNCCKDGLSNKNTVLYDEVKECILMPEVPGSCEKAQCFGTKLGFANPDGTIIIDKFRKHVEEKLSDHKDILAAVKKECLNDTYKLYGEADECELNKMHNCVLWQYIYRCPNISDEDTCKDIKDTAAKCLELTT